MNRTDALYQSFLDILREELVPAMGCTEPIAIAYAAAQARAVLGKRPERVRIEVSGNIIKNVKSVIVPHTGSMHGIAAAAAAGIIAGREDRELEVLSEVTQAQIEDMRAYLKEAAFEIRPIDSPFIFDIRITVCADGDQATARIVGSHTNLVQLLHGTTRIIDRPCSETVSERRTDRSILTVERIVDFADSLCPEDVQELFERQISYNMAIAEAGLSGSYGANVGRTLREAYGRLRAAGHHQFRFRQSGHHGLRAGRRLRTGAWREPRNALPGAGCVQSEHDPYQGAYRDAVRLLRSRLGRLRRGSGHYISLWRRI